MHLMLFLNKTRMAHEVLHSLTQPRVLYATTLQTQQQLEIHYRHNLRVKTCGAITTRTFGIWLDWLKKATNRNCFKTSLIQIQLVSYSNMSFVFKYEFRIQI